MNGALGQVVFWALAALALGGATVVVFTREVMRLAIGLGVFLLATAGLFLYYGAGFLAAAQVFVYVGGVLVLLLFAIMVVRRSGEGVPALGSRHDVMSAATSAVTAVLIAWLLLRGAVAAVPTVTSTGAEGLAALLLGPMLAPFEMLGVLLLAALVAVLAIVKGERT